MPDETDPKLSFKYSHLSETRGTATCTKERESKQPKPQPTCQDVRQQTQPALKLKSLAGNC